MRTIKFRAWSPVLKEMFYGADVSIAYDFDNESFIDYAFHNGEKVDELIMQFTGLHDKNGREIYEGDILRHSTGSVHAKVVYIPEHAAFLAHFVDNENASYAYFDSGEVSTQVEVIGNIYENPELLMIGEE